MFWNRKWNVLECFLNIVCGLRNFLGPGSQEGGKARLLRCTFEWGRVNPGKNWERKGVITQKSTRRVKTTCSHSDR